MDMEDLLRIADSFAREEMPESGRDCRVYPRSRFTVGNSRISWYVRGNRQLLAGGSGRCSCS